MRLLTASLVLWCALLAGTLGTMALADHPIPPVPEGGLTHLFQGECVDNETGERGMCYVSKSLAGDYYTVFYQDDVLMFIRKSLPGGSYETVWESHTFATY